MAKRRKSKDVVDTVGVESPAAVSDDKLMRRAEVAKRLGVSVSTVRRMEGKELQPVVGPRGVRYFSAAQVQTVTLSIEHEPVVDLADDGDVAADVFTLFDDGQGPVAVVKELRLPPSTVEALHVHWGQLNQTLIISGKGFEKLDRVMGWAIDRFRTEEDLIPAIQAKVEGVQMCQDCREHWAEYCRRCAVRAGKQHARDELTRRL